jgi:hypothetical protein
VSLLRADALRIPLRDESVDLIVTSPPYFALRSYRDGGEHFDGQIGSEPTPQAFLEALSAVTEEMARVLKPSGSIFVNLGDKYAGSGGHNNAGLSTRHGQGASSLADRRTLAAQHEQAQTAPHPNRRPDVPETAWAASKAHRGSSRTLPRAGAAYDEPRPDTRASRARMPDRAGGHGGGGAGRRNEQLNASRRNAPDRYNQNAHFDGAEYETRAKSLMLLPERYRIGAVDRLGLIAREILVWDKPNGLPESVTDRCRRSHEDWVHLTKEGSYFAAMDEVRVEHAPGAWDKGPRSSYKPGSASGSIAANGSHEVKSDAGLPLNPRGALPGSVWRIPGEPLQVPDYMVEDETGWRLMDARDVWRYALDRVERDGNDGPVMLRQVDHFACFPQEWPRRLILGWSPSAICLECGEGRRPTTVRPDVAYRPNGSSTGRQKRDELGGSTGNGWNRPGYPQTSSEVTVTGYVCACTPSSYHPDRRGKDYHGLPDRQARGMNDGRGGERKKQWLDSIENPRGPVVEYDIDGWTPPPTRPAVVLDPFCGTGTVPMVAKALGRFGIGLDLSADYVRLARWRVEQSGHARKTLLRTFAERNVEVPMFSTEEAVGAD